MVRSYKELFEILKKDFDLQKDEFIRDWFKIFPQLKKRMTRSNYTIKQLTGFLQELNLKLNEIEIKMRRYYQGTINGNRRPFLLLLALLDHIKGTVRRNNIEQNFGWSPFCL